MPPPSHATFVRRRLVALLALASVVVGVVLLFGGADSGPGGPRAAGPVETKAPRAHPRPSTTMAAIAARARVPVLCWHQIRPLTAADSAQDRVYIVPPTALDRQLGALKRAGYHSVSADQVADHMATGAALPRKPVLLSFDDASAGQYTRALPLLKKHGQTATFFVMTVVLGKPGWLTKGQVRKLDRAGMQIGVHTWDHHAVPDYVGDDWKVQLTEPKAELERIVGHRLDTFAYPFGLWNAGAFSHLREAGIRAAFQLSDTLDRSAPMLTARRVLVGPDVSGRRLLGMIRQDF